MRQVLFFIISSSFTPLWWIIPSLNGNTPKGVCKHPIAYSRIPKKRKSAELKENVYGTPTRKDIYKFKLQQCNSTLLWSYACMLLLESYQQWYVVQNRIKFWSLHAYDQNIINNIQNHVTPPIHQLANRITNHTIKSSTNSTKY